MTTSAPIRCRVAACREILSDDNLWSFYLINDSDAPLESVVLNQVGYEWGDLGNSASANVRITGLAAGAHALIWRDDSSAAEVRMDLSLTVRMGNREARLLFEFPKLYLQKKLPLVEGLGKPGWQEVAEG
jgi:hypothetical protein